MTEAPSPIDLPTGTIALVHRLADAAGIVCRAHFRTGVPVDHKGDESPVTLADRGAEEAIRAILSEVRPQDGVWGEEFGAEGMDREWVWVLDPIDGTKAFITGRPTFGTLIGLLHKGRPVLGVVDQPILRDRWIGIQGRSTELNGTPVATRACPSLDLATISTTGPVYFDGDGWGRYQAVAEKARIQTFGGDCTQYALLSSGFIDLVIEQGLKLHDYAALAPVVNGAGGRMTDWQGRELTMDSDGTIIASGDAAVHQAALAMLTA